MDTRTQGSRWSRRLLILAVATGAIAVVTLWLANSGSTSTPPAAVHQASTGAPDPVGQSAHPASPSATPPVNLPDNRVDPDSARQVALEYNKGRFNAFFDERMFLANSLANGKVSVRALKGVLLNIDALRALPANVHVLTAKPPAVVERMAMIDTLEALSEADPTALDALADLGARPIEAGLADQVKRAVAAEKYDVFVALSRKNWELAKQTFLSLQSPGLMDLLKPALIGGLVDSGLTRAQAVSTVDTLTKPTTPRDG
jgi:hypothetical protein